MTTRPPRASTKGDGKRPKARGATQGERPDKLDKRRSASVVPTDQFERITDDAVVEEAALPEVPRLRMLVLEGATHLASAQAAIVAAGHVVVAGAVGRDGIEKLRGAIGSADALLVALPGGEPLIEHALAQAPRRPVVIAACTSSNAVDAVRRATVAGADLVTVRPHDVERLAPLLLAAARLVEQRGRLVEQRGPLAEQRGPLAEQRGPLAGEHGPLVEQRGPLAAAGGAEDPPGELEDPTDREPGALQPFEVFQQAVEGALERARRYAYPLAIAMFGVDSAGPPPPPGVGGILRARAGNALVNAIRDVDLVTELEQDRFLVLLPYTDRLVGAEVARRIISAVAAADPVVAGGRTFVPKLIGAVAGVRHGETVSFTDLIRDVAQLLEQAAVTGASLAVES